MVKSNKKIVAGTEYDTNNDLQVRGSENEIRRITYADNPNVASSAQHIEEFASFLLTQKAH
jgi:hypothetical protein